MISLSNPEFRFGRKAWLWLALHVFVTSPALAEDASAPAISATVRGALGHHRKPHGRLVRGRLRRDVVAATIESRYRRALGRVRRLQSVRLGITPTGDALRHRNRPEVACPEIAPGRNQCLHRHDPEPQWISGRQYARLRDGRGLSGLRDHVAERCRRGLSRPVRDGRAEFSPGGAD